MVLKKITTIILFVCVSTLAGAQTSMRQLWLTMPDSLCVYLDEGRRTELVDFIDMGVKSEVKNLMNGQSVMDTLTADFTQVQLSESLTLQLKLLPVADADTLLCMVRTFSAPAAESHVSFFDTSWKPLSGDFGLTSMRQPESDAAATAMVENFVSRPDTMAVDQFQSLKKLIDPVMLSAELSPADATITFSLSSPLTTREEQEQLKAILLQRKFKWQAGTFK